jgi:photosystem II stability/assembly factor-like uncharacterized protein
MSKHAKRLMLAVTVVLFTGACLALAQAPAQNQSVWSNLKFRYIGPKGNRCDAVAGVPGDPLVYYAGAASGGIWKTGDGGNRWEPIFDAEPAQSIGALAVAASDPNIVWAGTGEPFIRSNISIGDGIYKSTDAGRTWTHMGLDKTGRIARVIIDPRNPDTVFACAVGTAYGPQPDRGVFRTTDGGKTWEKTLFVDENTGCSDLAMDPNNPRILFAGTWQLEIHTWGRTSGGPGSGIFRSADEGATWTRLAGHGLPHSPLGKIGLAIARNDSNRVYALIETGDGAPWNGQPTQIGQLWRSNDGGATWQSVSSDPELRGRTAYYTRVAVAPDNENEVYSVASSLSLSLDGGHTLTPLPSGPGAIPGTFGDNHDLWIDPINGSRMIMANDAGVTITLNHSHTWAYMQLPIAQIYHVTVDNEVPYFVYGNEQDGSSYRGPSNSLQFGGGGGGGAAGTISRSVWRPVGGGESGFSTPDPVDSNVIWSSGTGSGSVGGSVTRYDLRNHQVRAVEVWPESTEGATAAEVKYRFNWVFPILISPNDHNKIYVGSQYVHVSTDGGNSWQVISPDLTLNDKSREQSSGGLTPDNIGVDYAGVVYSLAESPKQPGVIWAGTNDGLVQLTRDGGRTWTNVTANIPQLPAWGTVTSIVASDYDAGTAYITVDFHQENNRDPFVYKTADFGKTWTAINNGVPPSMFSYAHIITEDPFRKGLLYLGTENALYVSFDDGRNWQPLQMNLPHAPVYGMTVQKHFHDLVLATYGRGFWILDDITPLEQLTPEVLGSTAYLFPPRDAYRFRAVTEPTAFSYDPTTGQNAPYGADINYFLKSSPQGDVHIIIQDAAGHTVRTLPGSKQVGINRIWWDLRFERTREIRLRTSPPYAPYIHVGPDGWRPMPYNSQISLLAPPGTYTVKLQADGQEFTQKLTVLKDPHSTGTEADIATNTRLTTAIDDDVNAIADGINQIESIRAQLADLGQQLGNGPNYKAIRDDAGQLDGKLVGVEGTLFQLKLTGRGQDNIRSASELIEKLIYLVNEVSGSDFPPTIQQVAVHDLLKQQLDSALGQLREIVSKDVAGFNATLRQRGVPNIVPDIPEHGEGGRGRGSPQN